MKAHRLAGMIGATVLGAIAVFQALLAAGLPLGRAAWGGQYEVLPAELRWASAPAVPGIAEVSR